MNHLLDKCPIPVFFFLQNSRNKSPNLFRWENPSLLWPEVTGRTQPTTRHSWCQWVQSQGTPFGGSMMWCPNSSNQSPAPTLLCSTNPFSWPRQLRSISGRVARKILRRMLVGLCKESIIERRALKRNYFWREGSEKNLQLTGMQYSVLQWLLWRLILICRKSIIEVNGWIKNLL